MKLILIAGKARSGKTETAKLLKNILVKKGYKVAITEYSKYIKLFAKELISWDGKEPKPRKFLQDFGYFIRHESENKSYFIDRMKEDIKIYEKLLDVLIISDVRLIEEIKEMQYLNPITIQVQNDNSLYDLTEEEKNHETERALDNYEKFEYSIRNKTPEEIQDLLKEIVKKYILDKR